MVFSAFNVTPHTHCKKSEKTFDKPDRQVYNTVEHE